MVVADPVVVFKCGLRQDGEDVKDGGGDVGGGECLEDFI